MAIPFDQRLVKLRIKMRRADEECDRRLAAYEKARQEAWQPVCEAQKVRTDLSEEYMRLARELGYCGSCEKAIEECQCVWMASSSPLNRPEHG